MRDPSTPTNVPRPCAQATTSNSDVTMVAIAVVQQDDRFLVGQRPAGAALAGYFEFPGGKVKPHESPAEAARRECLEETGLAVEVVDEYPPCTHDYSHGRLRLRFFRCSLAGPQMAPSPPFRWIRREELKKYLFPAANDELLSLIATVG